jgi:hypothetical protein
LSASKERKNYKLKQENNCEVEAREIKYKERNDHISKPLFSTIYNVDIAGMIRIYTHNTAINVQVSKTIYSTKNFWSRKKIQN